MDTLLPYIVYCIAMSGTPGPNNVMVLASGANFGLRRSQPHVWGINIGFAAMMFILALGLGTVFVAEPRLQLALKVVGIAYMLWLAWKIATATDGGGADGAAGGGPLTFVQAAAFQWVNPKAWMMCLGAISVYAPAGSGALEKALYLSGIMLLAGSPPTQVWAAFGVGIRRFLQNPRALRAFNVSMAVLLVLSLIPMLR